MDKSYKVPCRTSVQQLNGRLSYAVFKRNSFGSLRILDIKNSIHERFVWNASESGYRFKRNKTLVHIDR